MIFHSIEYALLLGVTWLLVWGVLRDRPSPRKLLLLAASYGFYCAWDVRFSLLLVFSTVLDYLVGGALDRQAAPRRRRALLAVSLLGNLGVLAVFKYWDFGLENLNLVLASLGLPASGAFLDILPPLGISFYTFQSMSYTLDIYRRKLEPANGILDFALFVAFFPQLVAGPIVRAREFLPQLAARPVFREEEMLTGLYRIVRGLIKKVVIADTLGRTFVDPVFADPGAASATAAVLAAYGFSAQILFDFEAYTDMALGSGRLLGFRFPENFRDPMRAVSFTDLWTRWHMTLSRFARDYLYVPLARAARRKAAPLQHLAVLFTMVLIGLWHGANWTFVAFGGAHGAALVVEALCRRRRSRRPRPPGAAGMSVWVPRLFTLHLAIAMVVVFRAATLGDAATLYRRALGGGAWAAPSAFPPDALLMLAAAYLLALTGKRSRMRSHRAFVRFPIPAQAAAYAAAAALVALYLEARTPFIYFAF